MKILVSIILCLMLSAPAFAKCIANQINVWPTGHTIKQNSIIMLEGYLSHSQEIIRGLHTKYPAYLESADHKVPLIVLETLNGEVRVSQAILRPAEKLLAGRMYRLVIENLPENPEDKIRIIKPSPTSAGFDAAQWTVTAGTDTEAPVFTSPPVEAQKILEYWGCGPEVYVTFGFDAYDDSEFLVKTTVWDTETKLFITYYLTARGKELYIGHGMCSGAFDLSYGKGYEVEFGLLDASGNAGKEVSDRIRFRAPLEK